jgi:nucleotide-binding universal stress UspA family protein
MKILIGYDGSEYDKVIINDLKQAGLPPDTEAILMTVANVREIPTSPFLAQRISSKIEHLFNPDDDQANRQFKKYLNFAREDARKMVEKLELTFPEWKINPEAVVGKPAKKLIQKADEWEPDILFVGSHGRSTLGRLFLGSVSYKVLNESHCSVRISKSKEGKKDSKIRVLLGVDGSKNAETVVQTVGSRIWPDETEIRLISVDDPFHRPEIGYMNWDHLNEKPIDNKKSRKWLEKIINEPAETLEAKGLNVSKKIIWGDAGNMILKEAKEWGADMIFLGARGLGPVQRFLLGSVSSWVATRSECPVEIVRI